MYCTACGAEISEHTRFCPTCGKATGEGASAPPPPPGPKPRLVRPMNEKRIAGVCAGVARHLGMDVTLLRVLWLCLAIFAGSGFLIYVICWIVIPADYGPVAAASPQQEPPLAHARSSE